MRYERAIGLSFDVVHTRLARCRASLRRVRRPTAGPTALLTRDVLKLTTTGIDLYQMFGTHATHVKWLSAGAGLVQASAKLSDGEIQYPIESDGGYLSVGAAWSASSSGAGAATSARATGPSSTAARQPQRSSRGGPDVLRGVLTHERLARHRVPRRGRTVTGSRHLLRFGERTWLFDCGLYQGHRDEAERVNRTLPSRRATWMPW
jgi:hypothetical protein